MDPVPPTDEDLARNWVISSTSPTPVDFNAAKTEDTNYHLAGHAICPPSTVSTSGKRKIDHSDLRIRLPKKAKKDINSSGVQKSAIYAEASPSFSQNVEATRQDAHTFRNDAYTPLCSAFPQGSVDLYSTSNNLASHQGASSYPNLNIPSSSTLVGIQSSPGTSSSAPFGYYSQETRPAWLAEEKSRVQEIGFTTNPYRHVGTIQGTQLCEDGHRGSPPDHESNAPCHNTELLIPASGTGHISEMQRFPHARNTAISDNHGSGHDSPRPISPSNDNYSVNESEEQDMAEFVDSFSAHASQCPPSSVLKHLAMDSDMEVYDPTLQRSPPQASHESEECCIKEETKSFPDEDLLYSDIDWDSIMDPDPSFSASTSWANPAPKVEPACGGGGTVPKTHIPTSNVPFPSSAMNKVPDVTGSQSSKMRTCFRVADLIQEGKKCFNVKQQATFEFFSWVTYSKRESSSKVQQFHFLDLFKEDPRLDLRGTLRGWGTGGLLDEQSRAFLDDGNNGRGWKLCRCICKLKQDTKVGMGWGLIVMWIQGSTWEEIATKERWVLLN